MSALHPQKEIIMAWLKGKKVQFRIGGPTYDLSTPKWHDVSPEDEMGIFDRKEYEWRISPDTGHPPINFRVALFEDEDSGGLVPVLFSGPNYQHYDHSSNPLFRGWVMPETTIYPDYV